MTTSDTEREPLRLILMKVENFLGLRVAELEPADGPITIVAGEHGAGKTALLDAVAALLNAKSPPDPIHHGASQAKVEGQLSNGLCIERLFKRNSSPKLKLTLDGQRLSSPASVLEALHANSFDPLEFDRMKKDERGAKLRDVFKLNWEPIEAEEKRLTEERRRVGREGKLLAAQLKGMPAHKDAPAEKLTDDELRAELRRRKDVNEALEDKVRLAKRYQREAAESVEQHAGYVKGLGEELAELKADLVKLQNEIEDCELQIGKAEANHVEAQKTASKRAEELAAAEAEWPQSLDDVKEQLAAIDETNAQVEARAAYLAKEQEVADKRAAYQQMTGELQALADEKKRQLAEADMPVPGLGFDDQGNVTLLSRDGQPVPWEQANMAQRYEASVAIGAAGNPELRLMIVRDGSLLRKEALETLAACLEKRDAHAIIEDARATDDEADVIVRAGEVVKP